MIIKSKFKDYEIIMTQSPSFVRQIHDENAFYVIDKIVYELYKDLFSPINPDRLYLLEASEMNKTMNVVLEICEKITNIAAKRNVLMISCGGGIIQDVSGFAANIIYRGIRWVYIPTTLLAACDSCIGGKTSLNYKKYKNLLGTFYPPDDIYIYPKFFDTLSHVDYNSGLGEVVKFNVMAGMSGLLKLEKNMGLLLNRDQMTLQDFVNNSLEFKKKIIEVDEFDRGQRILLNFAHTFGHALEATSQFQIPHGTAVALGMLIANHISVSRTLLNADIAERIEELVKKIIIVDLNQGWFNVPDYILAIKKDKKQIGNELVAILMNNNFELKVYKDITENEIILAVNDLQTHLIAS